MKKTFNILAFLVIAVFCRAGEPVELSGLKSIFDKYGVDGSVLIYNQQENTYMGYNLKRCNTPYCPASTFKIPNTLIALETGVITPETIFPWNGEKQRLPRWEQDLDIAGAFRVSSVPIYQEIARRIGEDRMQYYLRLINYNGMEVYEDNIDTFWLEGNSAITPYQQLYFLQQLYNSRLPISEKAMQQTRQIMEHEKTANYTLSGKTGWATRQETDITWFIGWVEANDNVWIFVTNLETDVNTRIENFGQLRIDLTKDVLKTLEIIP